MRIMKEIIVAGSVITIVGLILILFGIFSSGSQVPSKTFVGGVIGFIPFGFSNDKRMFYVGLALTVGLALFYFFLPFFIRR